MERNLLAGSLHQDDYDQWLHGPLDDVIAFQARCFPDELIEVERTSELWVKRSGAATMSAKLL